MFKNLIKLLATSVNENITSLALKMGTTKGNFFTVIRGNDMRISILVSVCKACNCDIIITNHSTININLAEYINQQQQQQQTNNE